MAGITLCTNKLCPLAYKCKRAIATPSDWQSFAEFKPYTREFSSDVDCDHFWFFGVTVKTTNGAIE